MEANDPVIEEVQIPESWSEEDRVWLKEHVNPMYHKQAVKYGRLLFVLVLQAGLIGEALSVIQRHSAYIGGRKQQEIMVALQILMTQTNDLHQGRMRDNNITLEQFREVKRDMETLGSLAQTTPAPGKIIVPH